MNAQKHILEIGPGLNPRCRGENVVYLDRLKLDFSNSIIWNLEELPLPFPDSTFDEIYASHVLEHIAHLYLLFDELHRIMKPKGLLRVWVPHIDNELYLEGIYPDHLHFFNERSFYNLERDSTFGIRRWGVLKQIIRQYKDSHSITCRGRFIKAIWLRKLVWFLLNWRKARRSVEIYIELMAEK